jgi:hypothetical protein
LTTWQGEAALEKGAAKKAAEKVFAAIVADL